MSSDIEIDSDINFDSDIDLDSDIENNSNIQTNSDIQTNSNIQTNSSRGKNKKIFKDAKYCSFINAYGNKCTTRILKKNISNNYCTTHLRKENERKLKQEEKEKDEEEKRSPPVIDKQINEWGIDIPLFLHQQKSVTKMIQYENEQFRNFQTPRCTNTVSSRVHILSDKVGSGKTLSTISFLSLLKDEEEKKYQHTKSKIDFDNFTITPDNIIKIPGSDSEIKQVGFKEINTIEHNKNVQSTDYFYVSSTYNKSYKIINTNIIVCGASVYNQWINELNHSNLKYRVIYKSNDYRCISEWINTYDVILVTYNRYNEFQYELSNYFYSLTKFNSLINSKEKKPYQGYNSNDFNNFNDYCVKRLIFDELQTSGRLQNINAFKYWIISGTLNPTSQNNYYYHERDKRTNMICNILSNCTNHYINVGNSEEIISQSYKQAEMKEFIYKCYVRNLNMLKGYLPNEVQRMIAAEDIAGVV
jgi:hypothetical protein